MSKARVAPKAPKLSDVAVTFTSNGRSWTTTGSKLALAFYEATAGSEALRERASNAARRALEAVCQATLADSPSDRFACFSDTPPPMPLVGLTFTHSRWTYTAEDVARLLAFVSYAHDGHTRQLVNGDDVPMILDGVENIMGVIASDGDEPLGRSGAWLLGWLMKFASGLTCDTAKAAASCTVALAPIASKAVA